MVGICAGSLLAPYRVGAGETPEELQRRATALILNNRGITEAKAGQFEAGAAALRQALALDPKDVQVRNSLSNILADWASRLLKDGQTERADTLLQEAIEANPSNGTALTQLGDLAYYTQSDFERAITCWKQANGHVSPSVWHTIADRITQAERDQRIERGFEVGRTAHFNLRGQAEDRAAMDVLGQKLEMGYEQLAASLGRGPATVTVIVYSADDLKRTYNQRDWAIGFYDGRLRLRRDELTSPILGSLIAHELTHAFLHYLYGNQVPVWVHEGFAQWQEGDRPRSPEETQLEEQITSRAQWVPLEWLDRRFTHPSGIDDVRKAYAQSRVAVTHMITRYGLVKVRNFLSALKDSASVERAYDQTFGPSTWAKANQGIFD